MLDKLQQTKGYGNVPKGSASAPEMRAVIKEQTQVFNSLKSQVDETKTKYNIDDFGNVTYTYYDKNGKELYNMTDVNGFGGNIYGFSHGNSITRFHDYDKDGKMDRMDYILLDDGPRFQATDLNDDGKFDKGMPNSGKHMGEEYDL